MTVEITDDGAGGADAAKGSGLRGLADRVAALDGTLSVESPPDGPKRRRCTMMPGVSEMDDYVSGLPAEEKAALERVRAVVQEVAPTAEEGVSYGMPAYLHAGRPLLGFRAAKSHLSVFPFSPAAIEAVEDRLEGFHLSKGTIRFSPETPVPDDVLADLVRARMEEIGG